MTGSTSSASQHDSAETGEPDLASAVKALLGDATRADMHHLLDVDPFRNKYQGWDLGWSCRDHAVVLSALLAADGVDSRVVHGMNMFIAGPTSDGQHPVGIGNELQTTDQGGSSHSWVDVPGFGMIDLSPRLSERLPGPLADWRPLPTGRGGPVGTEWSVPGLASAVATVNGGAEYERAIAHATHAVDTVTAIYWPKRSDSFSAGMLKAEYVNSPLTDKVAGAVGDDCYLLLAVHLHALRAGERRPLAGVSQNKAWSFVKDMERTAAAAVDTFCSQLGGS